MLNPYSDYINPATLYPNPLKMEGWVPHPVPCYGAPKRMYPGLIEAIKGSIHSKIRVICYANCTDFVNGYVMPFRYNILVYLVNDCETITQNEVLNKIHPFELAKMLYINGELINLKSPFSGYMSYFMSRQDDFVDRLTQQAHFFLLFEYFRDKHFNHHENILISRRLDEFVSLVQAVRRNESLPQLHFLYDFSDRKYSSLCSALIKACTERREDMKSNAEWFVEFITTDLELKDDVFSSNFMFKLSTSNLLEQDEYTGIELHKM